MKQVTVILVQLCDIINLYEDKMEINNFIVRGKNG
jgi:hypothetical protein